MIHPGQPGPRDHLYLEQQRLLEEERAVAYLARKLFVAHCPIANVSNEKLVDSCFKSAEVFCRVERKRVEALPTVEQLEKRK